MTRDWAPPRTPAGWLFAAQEVFDEFVGALARYGVSPDPRLRLIPGDSAAPYYEPATMTIGVAMPDPETAAGRLFWILAARMLGVGTPEEAVAALGLQLPLVTAHEVAHHLRHRYGAPIENDFVEEQVVNVIALAFLREHPVYRRTIPALLDIARSACARLEAASPAASPYLSGFRLDLGEVLVAQGRLTRERLERARSLARAARRPLEEVLAELELGDLALDEAARARAESEAYFNGRYMLDLAEYGRFGEEWLLAYLKRQDLPSLGETLEAHVLTSDWEHARREETRSLLVSTLGHPVQELAAAAAEALAEELGAGAVGPLLGATEVAGSAMEARVIVVLGRVAPGDLRLLERAQARLTSGEPELVCAAAGLLVQTGHPNAGDARAILAELAAAPGPGRLEALEALGRVADPRFAPVLLTAAGAAEPREREAALRALAALEPGSGADLAQVATDALADPDDGVRRAAASLVRRHGGTAETLVAALADPVEAVREDAAAALRALGTRAVPALAAADGSWYARSRAARLLHALDGRQGERALRGLVAELCAWAERLVSIRAGLARESEEAELLRTALEEEARKLALLALRSAGSLGGERAMEIAVQGLVSGEEATRSAAAEIALRAAPADLAPLLAPLAAALAGGREEPSASPSQLEELAAYPEPLLRELAEVVGTAGRGADEKEDPMLTAVEKIMFLRAVPLFAGVAVEDLRTLAEDFLVERYRVGEEVVRAGEEPQALYVVVAGEIALERPDESGAPITVGRVRPRQPLGETALLAGRPSSLTARAVRETTLLALARERFLRLGVRHPQILVQLVRALSGRLLDAEGALDRPEPETLREPMRGLSYVWELPAGLRRSP